MIPLWRLAGIAGLLLIIAGVIVTQREREDILYILGGAFLLAYSISIRDPIFIVLQAVFICAAGYDLARLKLGK